MRGAVWLPKARASSTVARVGWRKPILSRIAHEYDLEQQPSELILQGLDNAGHNLRTGRARALRVSVRVRVTKEPSKARDRPDRQVNALVIVPNC